METSNIDSYKYLSSNQRNRVYNSGKPSLLKNSAGCVLCNCEKPFQLNVDGHKIPNVYPYSVVDYKDAITNNGKLYDIKTVKSNISLYTHDNKFAMLREYFQGAQSLDINGKKLYGHIIRTLFKDGTQKYEVVTPNYKTKIINLDAFGKEIVPKQMNLKVINKMFKQTRKLLKFLF